MKNVASVQSPLWETPAGEKWFEYEVNILTSLDACWELWEKDMPDKYWWRLAEVVTGNRIDDWTNYNLLNSHWLKTLRATCPQRICALLRWKGVE